MGEWPVFDCLNLAVSHVDNVVAVFGDPPAVSNQYECLFVGFVDSAE